MIVMREGKITAVDPNDMEPITMYKRNGGSTE